jgi:alpha-galactosidase
VQLRILSKDQLEIITNRELLAFNQDDQIGTPAKPFDNAAGETMSPPEYYSGKSSLGTHVFIVNTNNGESNKTVEFASIPDLEGVRFLVHDMWTTEDLGVFTETFTITLAAHDTAAFRVTVV